MTDALRCIAYRALPFGHLPQYRYLPGARYVEQDGLRLLGSGEIAPDANVVVALDTAHSLDRVLTIATDFFGPNVPFAVRVDGDAPTRLEAALRSRGWQSEDDHPAMVLTPIPAAPSPLPNLTIRRVTTEPEFEAWFEGASSGARGPDDPPEIDYNRHYIRSFALALDPDVALFTGYLDGRPVASSALYRIDGIAEIGAVAVHPEHRRHGIGAAMTWAAIGEGAARGCYAAALRSSDMAVSVYERMGFMYVCTFRTYTPPTT